MTIAATWYGTAAVHLVVDGALGIFFDPWFARPPGAHPRIVADPATVDLQPLDTILVSHSHFDHIINLPDLVRRYSQVQAYVPAMTAENCRKLCRGAIFKEYSCILTDSDWARIHTVTAGDRAELSSRDGSIRLQATAIRSGHVRFDAYSVLRVISNPRVIWGISALLEVPCRISDEGSGWLARARGERRGIQTNRVLRQPLQAIRSHTAAVQQLRFPFPASSGKEEHPALRERGDGSLAARGSHPGAPR